MRFQLLVAQVIPGFSECQMKISYCYSAAYNGCTATAYADSGWKMTRGDCGATMHNIWVRTSGASSNSITCYCHDYAVAKNAYCYAYLWQCR